MLPRFVGRLFHIPGVLRRVENGSINFNCYARHIKTVVDHGFETTVSQIVRLFLGGRLHDELVVHIFLHCGY